MRYLLVILTLTLSCKASYFSLPADEATTDCYSIPSDFNYHVCFNDNLEQAVDDTGVKWMLEGDSSDYHAITVLGRSERTNKLIATTYYKTSIEIGVIAHEVSHVAEFLDLHGEKRADFIGIYTNFTHILVRRVGIEVYIPYINGKTVINYD